MCEEITTNLESEAQVHSAAAAAKSLQSFFFFNFILFLNFT